LTPFLPRGMDLPSKTAGRRAGAYLEVTGSEIAEPGRTESRSLI
jgi:hypothetical protein